MEIPRVGVELELRLLAYVTATVTQDLNHVCDLHHSSWQSQILNPLSKARDRIRNLMVPSWIRFWFFFFCLFLSFVFLLLLLLLLFLGPLPQHMEVPRLGV